MCVVEAAASPKTEPEIAPCDGRFVLAIPVMLGMLAVNVPSSEGCVMFALPVSVSAAMLVVLATLAVVIFALPSMSSAVLANVAETPVTVSYTHLTLPTTD